VIAVIVTSRWACCPRGRDADAVLCGNGAGEAVRPGDDTSSAMPDIRAATTTAAAPMIATATLVSLRFPGMLARLAERCRSEEMAFTIFLQESRFGGRLRTRAVVLWGRTPRTVKRSPSRGLTSLTVSP
jgi:hypothetical protein